MSLNTCKNLSPLLEIRSLYYNLPFYLALALELHGETALLHCAVCCIRSRASYLVRRYNQFSIVVTFTVTFVWNTIQGWKCVESNKLNAKSMY